MSVCTRCGARFSCGMVDGHEDEHEVEHDDGQDKAPCWCSGLPALPAAAIGSDNGKAASCLCPACLRAAVAALPPTILL